MTFVLVTALHNLCSAILWCRQPINWVLAKRRLHYEQWPASVTPTCCLSRESPLKSSIHAGKNITHAKCLVSDDVTLHLFVYSPALQLAFLWYLLPFALQPTAVVMRAHRSWNVIKRLNATRKSMSSMPPCEDTSLTTNFSTISTEQTTVAVRIWSWDCKMHGLNLGFYRDFLNVSRRMPIWCP